MREPFLFRFLLTGFATGLLGTACGIATGLLVAVNINEVIAGLEWIVNRILEAASLFRSGFQPSAQGFGTFTLFNSAYYLKSIPIRIDAPEVLAVGAATLLLCALALLAAGSASVANPTPFHPPQGLKRGPPPGKMDTKTSCVDLEGQFLYL